MKKSTLILLFLLSSILLNAASVNILNDSPFPLHAEIISADGMSKGKVQIAPQQQINWVDTSGYQATISQTPYTVIFTCPNGKIYGVYSGISPGALVTAQSSTGNRYCEPNKKGQKEREAELKTPAPSPGHLRKDAIWGPP